MESEDEISAQDLKKIFPLAGIVVLVLLTITIAAYLSARKKTPEIVLPGGVTYLGPSSSPTSPPAQASGNTIQIPADTKWTTQIGKKYPYSFLYPSSLSLGVFPNDPFDAVTIFWNSTNPSNNIFLRVEDLHQIDGAKNFIGTSKKDYAMWWWKQYSWKGVGDVTEFTNSQGLKGYRAKYINEKGETPYDNIFLEVPGRSDLVIWMASGLLEQPIFDKIVDSVSWKATP